MSSVRIIARLDIKAPNLIKGIHLEGLRKLGEPNKFASRYYDQGADELIYMDAVASLYERNGLADIVEATSREVFIPMTVGGGVRSLEDAQQLLRAGADKIAINTAAVRNPVLISQMAQKYGSQCMVLSIEAKALARQSDKWEAFTDNGREHTGLDVLEWARRGAELGAGEILLTSVDKEGTGKGFDCDLVRQVSDAVAIPVIASGGMGKIRDFVDVVERGHADAVAIANVIHYDRISLADIRSGARSSGIRVRGV